MLAPKMLLKHGFEPQMSVSLATERMAICVITITYDRAEPGADARALQCYRALAEALQAEGYPLYRRNVSAMDVAPEMPAYAELLRELKSAVDPERHPGAWPVRAARRGGPALARRRA